MIIELVKKIEEIINAYHANNEIIEKEVKRIVEEWSQQVDAYKMEYIKEQIRSEITTVRTNSENINKVYNQKLRVILDDTKKLIFSELFNNASKSSDYATRINNALQFIILEGEEINDDKAYMILKDFIDDLEQMKLFKNVIGKKVELEDGNGNSTFPKTFGKLNKIETILNTFNEMENITSMLFVYPREDGQTFIVNGKAYSIPVDSYEQMSSETNIIKFAKIVEEYAETIPGIDLIADDTEHEMIEN